MPNRVLFAFALTTVFMTRAFCGGIAYSRILTTGNQPGTIIAMAVDSAGNAFLTGAVSAADFPTTPGAVQSVFGGGSCGGGLPPSGGPTIPCTDAFLIRLDPQGNVVYSTYFGGNGMDWGSSIAVDPQGNVYVSGAAGQNFPVTFGAAFMQHSGADAFIAKFNPAGALVYSTLLPHMQAGAIAVNSAGEVFFGGLPVGGQNPGIPASTGAFQGTVSGSLICKLSADGSKLLYATYLGRDSVIRGLAIDSVNSVYVTGNTTAAGFVATSGSFQPNSPAPTSAFVVKLTPDASALVYSTYLGGTSGDVGLQIRVDGQGEAVVMGIAQSADFPITLNAFDATFVLPAWAPPNNTFVQRFITKLSSDGKREVFSTYFPDADSIDVDAAGNTYVAGLGKIGFPQQPGATQPCFAGGQSDVLLAQLGPTGSLVAATYLGGSAADGPGQIPAGLVLQSTAQAIAVGLDGSVYTAGGTQSSDFPNIGAGSINALSNFAAKLLIADPNVKTISSCTALAVSNGANFVEGPIAPGELVTLRGTGIGPAQGTSFQLDQNNLLPTLLGGTQVLFDGVPVPVLYAQDQQVNAQAPFELVQSSTQIQVVYNGTSSNTAKVAVQSAAPGIFHIGFPDPQAAIINQDGTVNSKSNPAPRGTYVSVYGTGGGSTAPATITGGLAPGQTVFLQPTLVLLGSIPQTQGTVIYAGSAPTLQTGVFQIVFLIPTTVAPGVQAISITMGHVAATDPQHGTTIAIQ
jgi:uncharacterized protein (TIGR03437 family)